MEEVKKISIAVVGLGFGAEFVPIYLDHPNIKSVAISDQDDHRLRTIASRFGIVEKYRDFSDVISNPQIDAVHLVTGIPDHARQAVDVLNSGKHCACTVPMATSMEDLEKIIVAQQRRGKNYMMMETAVYTREFLLAQQLRKQVAFGRIQFLRGALYNDMEAWPAYWAGLPPMWYATHALNPLLAIAGARAVKVHCRGTGLMREELHSQYGNPYPIETAVFQLEQPGLCAEVTVGLFYNARPYIESFVIYGENACYEWQMEDEAPVLFTMSPVVPHQQRKGITSRPEPEDRIDLLPPSIARYTKRLPYVTRDNSSIMIGGGHHGSHPHLVHEFISSIIDERPPCIDALTAANWTAAGICAHDSAMLGGKGVTIPDFGRIPGK